MVSESGSVRSAPSTHGLLESLSRRLENATPYPESRRVLEEEVLSAVPVLEPPRVAELVARVHAAEVLRTADFLEELVQVLSPSLPRFGSPYLTRVLAIVAAWALFVGGDETDRFTDLSESVKSFFNAASAELSLRLMDVAPRDLSHIAAALASVGLAEERFFASLARASVARSERFLPQELVALAEAFDKACLVHTALFEALARCLKNNLREVPLKDLLKGMRALAACCVPDRELGHNIGNQLPRRAQQGGLSGEEFCSLAWTFCAVGFYHDVLFRAAFSALEDAPTIAGETLCQLYEIHLTLRAFRHDLYRPYELEDTAVQSLRDHYKKHKGGRMRESRLERTTEKVQKDIAEVLEDVVDGQIVRQHQTALGFTVDLAVMRRRSQTAVVLIDVDGPHTLLRSLDPMGAAPQLGQYASRVRGAVLLKRRVLQKYGFRLVVLSEAGQERSSS